MSQTTPGSDPVYKRLYAFPEMVEDLLRSLFPPKTLGAVDWPSLDRLPADYVGDDFRRRHGDAVWRVRLRPEDGREEWLYVLVLLEFQSTTDAGMALRVLEYTAMLYRELLRGGRVKLGELPPVLPVVLYNGDAAWSAATEVRELIAEPGASLLPYQPSQRHAVLDERHASADDTACAGTRTRLKRLTRAVVLLEQSRSPADLAHVARLLRDWLGSADGQGLKRAFADWLWLLGQRLERGGDKPPAVPPELTLEDVTMTLEERVISWREPLIRQGMEQGIRQGVERGIRQGVERGIRQGVERGIRQGVERGIRQGLDRERGLLRRLAEVRFGTDTGERLFRLLAREDDPQRLAAVGEAIVRCEASDDLFRQAFPNAHGTAD